MKERTQGNLILLIVAFIWGSTFVAQSSAMDYIGPFAYNLSRNVVACIVLLPVLFLFCRKKGDPISWIRIDGITLKGGIFCGAALFGLSSFQQIGVSFTSAGKAGFITTLYIVLVPLFGLVLGKRVGRLIWVCIALAISGLFMLSVKEDFTLSSGDLLVLVCACFCAIRILMIDHFVLEGADSVKMSFLQFIVAGTLSAFAMLLFEQPTWSEVLDARFTILYAGVLSSGVAYTLQIIAQKRTEATVASLIMSLESIFAALSGWLVLNEILSLREIMGCALVFAAVILAELSSSRKVEIASSLE